MKVMESTIDDWSKETVAQAQKDLEEQKMAWELQQQKSVQEARMDIDDSSCATEDLLTYSNVESSNQVKYFTRKRRIMNGNYCKVAAKS